MVAMALEIVVYGASGFGQQVMSWADDAADAGAPWRVAGFLDDDPAKHGSTRVGRPVLGGAGWLEGRDGVLVVLGAGMPADKRRIVERVAAARVAWPVLVHPTASVSRFAELAEGAVVGPQAVVAALARVGPHTTLATAATLGHETVTGACASVLPGANVAGRCTVGDAAVVGIGAAVVQGAAVGAGAVVGAGATVLRDVPSGATVVGTPARPPRAR
jgi:sugar O-acyltransferase (sialic acid O-acetyltransferase NeuD family)